jgi:hypothetical protein
MIAAPLFQHHFQIAYVVNDVGRAVQVFRDRFDVARWNVRDMAALTGGASLIRRLALAWIGDDETRVQIELIEPDKGTPSLYANWTEAGSDRMRLHHHGFLVHSPQEWQIALDAVARAEIPIARQASFGNAMDYFYADTRAELGHYLEVIHLKPEGAAFFADVPHN